MSNILNLEDDPTPQISLIKIRQTKPEKAHLSRNDDVGDLTIDFTSPVMRKDMIIVDDFSPTNQCEVIEDESPHMGQAARLDIIKQNIKSTERQQQTSLEASGRKL
jgi:hypothetical protein